MALLETLIENRWPLLAGIIVLYVVRKLLQYRKVSRFGGPRWTGVTKIPHNMRIFTGDAHQWYQDINEKYGNHVLPSHGMF